MTMPCPSENALGEYHGTCPRCTREFSELDAEFWDVTQHRDTMFGTWAGMCPWCDFEYVDEDYCIAERDYG